MLEQSPSWIMPLLLVPQGYQASMQRPHLSVSDALEEAPGTHSDG